MRLQRECVNTEVDNNGAPVVLQGCGLIQYTPLSEYNSLPSGWRGQVCSACGTPTLNAGVLVSPTRYKSSPGRPDKCLCKVLKSKRFICTYHMLKLTGVDPDKAADEILALDTGPTIFEQYEQGDDRKTPLTRLPKARLVSFGLMNDDSLGIDTEHMMSEVLPRKRHWSRIPARTSDQKDRGYVPGLIVTKADGTQIATGPRGGTSEDTKAKHQLWTKEELARKTVNKANRLLNLKQNRMNAGTLGARVQLEGGKQ